MSQKNQTGQLDSPSSSFWKEFKTGFLSRALLLLGRLNVLREGFSIHEMENASKLSAPGTYLSLCLDSNLRLHAFETLLSSHWEWLKPQTPSGVISGSHVVCSLTAFLWMRFPLSFFQEMLWQNIPLIHQHPLTCGEVTGCSSLWGGRGRKRGLGRESLLETYQPQMQAWVLKKSKICLSKANVLQY